LDLVPQTNLWRSAIALEYLLNTQEKQNFTYDFLSNVPEDRREALKNDRNFPFPPPLISAPLMAEKNSANFSEVSGVEVSGVSPELHQPYRTDNKFSIKPSSITSEDIAFSVERIDIGMLEVATNGTGRFNTTTSLSPLQVATAEVGMISVVGTGTNQPTILHITADEFSRQLTFQNRSSQVDITQMSAAQINRSQVNPTQVNLMQNNVSEISFPIGITLEQFLGLNNFWGISFNSPIWHSGVAENRTFVNFDCSQVGVSQVSTNQLSSSQVSTSQIGITEVNINQSSASQISFSEIGGTQIAINQKTIESGLQVGTTKVGK
jgi:hypothetical protein